jgi:hypothetical protein
MSTQTEDQTKQAQARAARLERVMEGYELDPSDPFDHPDPSVPGAARVEVVNHLLRSHPRYVLVTQYGDRGNYRVYLGNSRLNVEELAARAIRGEEDVICYYDLDQLAGPEPRPQEGERMPVRYGLAKVVVSVVFNTEPSLA